VVDTSIVGVIASGDGCRGMDWVGIPLVGCSEGRETVGVIDAKGRQADIASKINEKAVIKKNLCFMVASSTGRRNMVLNLKYIFLD